MGENDGHISKWKGVVWDANQLNRVGTNAGFCVLIGDGYLQNCFYAVMLDGKGPDGFIAQGVREVGAAQLTFAITGGTGKYAHVSGSMTITPGDGSWAWKIKYKM
jgi:hypothetical protein